MFISCFLIFIYTYIYAVKCTYMFFLSLKIDGK